MEVRAHKTSAFCMLAHKRPLDYRYMICMLTIDSLCASARDLCLHGELAHRRSLLCAQGIRYVQARMRSFARMPTRYSLPTYTHKSSCVHPHNRSSVRMHTRFPVRAYEHKGSLACGNLLCMRVRGAAEESGASEASLRILRKSLQSEG